MPAPHNPFKAALAARKPHIGLASPITAELCSHAGFDWLVVDGEHGPNDIPTTGPSDLAAAMGLLGRPAEPQVQRAVEAAIARIHSAGKPAGVLTGELKLAQHYLDLGATFLAVGTDVGLLTQGASQLAARFKAPVTAPSSC